MSQQNHYEFGMKAIKSLLVIAGSLKRPESNFNEEVLLVRAIREIGDLFLGIQIGQEQNIELEIAIKKVIELNNLQEEDTFIEKVIQFHEKLKVRFGLMLIGVTMGGKTQVQKVLKDSYSQLHDQAFIGRV